MNSHALRQDFRDQQQAGHMAQLACSHTSVNVFSGLSTDFLNQFNEVAMILEMMADWPEGLNDLRHWQPRGYIEHFEKSGFKDTDAVIGAYRAAPKLAKGRFDAQVRELDLVINAGLGYLFKVAKNNPPVSVWEAAHALSIEIQNGVASLRRMINAGPSGTNQIQIDMLIDGHTANAQLIDALFE